MSKIRRPEGDGEPTQIGHPQPGVGEGPTQEVYMPDIIGQMNGQASGVVGERPLLGPDDAMMIDVEVTFPTADILRGRKFVEYIAGQNGCTLPGSAFTQTRIDDETTFTVGEESLKFERRGLASKIEKIGGLTFYIRKNGEVLVVNRGKEPITFRQVDEPHTRAFQVTFAALDQTEEEFNSGEKLPDLLGGSPTTTFVKAAEPKPVTRSLLARILGRSTAETGVKKSRISLVENKLVEIDLTGITEGDLKCEALKLSIKLIEDGNVTVTFNSKSYPVARKERITLPNGVEIGLTSPYRGKNRLRLRNPDGTITFDSDCPLTAHSVT